MSFLDRIKSYFGMESQQTAEEIAYLEAKKQGYSFPHWSSVDGQCLVGVKPGFLQQCRALWDGAVFNKGGECTEAADCACDAFDLRGAMSKARPADVTPKRLIGREAGRGLRQPWHTRCCMIAGGGRIGRIPRGVTDAGATTARTSRWRGTA